MKNKLICAWSVIFLILLTVQGKSQNTATYQESFDMFNNPERGFLEWTNSALEASGCVAGDYTPCQQTYELLEDKNTTWSNFSTIQRIFNLHWFINDNSTISQWYLDNMQADFDFLRANGLKATILFEYVGSNDIAGDYDMAEYAKQNSSPNAQTVINHIDQITPIIQRNSDVIYSMRAGFIGPFGEWWGQSYQDTQPDDFGQTDNCDDTNFGLQNYQLNNRRMLLDKLLDILPKNRMIELRNIQEKERMYNLDIQTEKIQTDQAFDGSNISTYYTYCCTMSNSDFYDYIDYTSNETAYTPSYAEFFFCNKPQFYRCDFVIPDMEEHHLTTLRATDPVLYSAPESWTNGNCLDEIKRRLGYRLKMNNASVTAQAQQGKTIDLNINLENVGFSSPVNPRNVQLVLRHTSTGAEYKVNLCNRDPRYWFPNQSISINESIGIPNNIPSGTYSLFLNLNDPEPTLYNDPRYSIRFANQNVWESNTGYNRLSLNVQIGNYGGTTYTENQWLATANSVDSHCNLFYPDGSINGSRNENVDGGGGGGNCPNDLTITTTYNSGDNIDVEAANTITASNIINSGATIDYNAGYEIKLVDGFHAKYGAHFRAFIDGCINALLVNKNSDNIARFDHIPTMLKTNVSTPIPNEVTLRNYPNPFKGTTTIEYTLPQAGKVSMRISDLSGQVMAYPLSDKLHEVGVHVLQFDATALPVGIYLCTLRTAHTTQTHKITVFE